MSDKYIICIDLGTMGTKAAIVSTEGEILAKTLEESKLYYPKPGWVEQKPNEMFNSTLNTIKTVVKETGISSSHDFDSIRWLIGSNFKQVYALADNFKLPQYKEKYPDFYDTVAVILKFENGVLGMIDGCCPATYGYDVRVEILGTEGMLQIGSKQAYSVLVWNKDKNLISEGNQSWRTLFKDAYEEGARHFVNCILTDSEPKVGIIDGKKALEIVIAANKSIKIGKPIDL